MIFSDLSLKGDDKVKRRIVSILLVIMSCIGVAGMFTSCDESSSDYSFQEYAPGNPQYDYDAWKYGIDHPGFYDD